MDGSTTSHLKRKNRQNRTEAGKSITMKVKMILSSGKIMVSGFCDVHGLIFTDYLQKRKTINNEYYANLLQRLTDKIKKKWPHLEKNKMLFNQDNAPVHISDQ